MKPELLVLPELGGWASQWDHLIDLSPLPSPFLRSWWLSGTAGPRPRFILAVRDDRLLGGLAVEEEHRLGIPYLTMMGAGPLCPDHLDLLAAPGEEDVVVSRVSAWLRRPGTRVMDFAGIRTNSHIIKALPGSACCEPLAVAPWVPLLTDAEAYLAARPARFRKNLRRASARLAAEGVIHRIHRESSAVHCLDILRQLHSLQWGNRSRFLPSFDRFAAGCRRGAEADEVAVHDLTAGETVIAIMVTFEVAGRVSLYQSARLTDFRWRDATTVLLAAVISHACQRGFTEIDFLRGDEAYKDNFAPERRELLRLRAASDTTGRVMLAADTSVRKARHLLARYAHGDRRPYKNGGKNAQQLQAAGGKLTLANSIPRALVRL